MIYDNGLLDLASSQYKMSAMAGGAGAFAQMASSQMDYSALQTNAYALQVQANSIELQAKQRANMLREQFVSAIGSYQFGAANRGVSVGSGSVRQNIESSAISLGKDIQSQQKVAQMQANALRSQASIAKMQAKSARVSGILSGISSLSSAVLSYATGQQLGKMAENKGTQVYGSTANVGPFKK